MKSNSYLRQESIKRVLLEIKHYGPISKRELQRITDFSWGNISSVITLLLNENYIMASGKQETSVGRKPEEYDINANDNYIIGIDFNSEGILLVLCDLKGRAHKKYETKLSPKTKEAAIDALFNIIGTVLNENQGKKIYYVALAMQGKIDTVSGKAVRNLAIEGWRDIAVCEMIKNRFGLDALLLHDPDCLLYTEKNLGLLSEETPSNAILLRIDHGIGIAALLDGKIYMGNKEKTCEIGSTIVPSFGSPAFLKNVVKEKAVEREYLLRTNKILSCPEIAEMARDGDNAASEIFKNLGSALAVAINNASSLLNPEKVVLFGEFLKYSPLFLPETERVLKTFLSEEAPPILISEQSGSGAAIGASLFAADRVIESLEFGSNNG